MGFFDSINPFKKKEEFSFTDDNLHPTFDNNHPNLENTPNFNTGFSAPSPLDDHRMQMPLGENIRQQRINNAYGDNYNEPIIKENPLQKDLELISSKLDYLKASIESINQRLANLEHLVRQDMEKKKWY